MPVVSSISTSTSASTFASTGTTHAYANGTPEISRNQWITMQVQMLASTLATTSLALISNPRSAAAAAERNKSLDQCLYTIMRVREAMFQESRLIKTGKFKDVQRANVKLAIKFILNNYRLSDTVINASAFIESNDRRVTAGQLGQSAVQDLQTILEYFDSSDVQNIKVDNMAGKERLVLQGLESAGKNIDAFLTYFPKEQVDAARSQVLAENELNFKEWDRSLGEIVNLPPAV
ncbi:hypothetical protein MHU86_4752 [Fragilaria crotonensis]|nr:hypothetical protein MHU86_4752 [Fragilaria crotonensis]